MCFSRPSLLEVYSTSPCQTHLRHQMLAHYYVQDLIDHPGSGLKPGPIFLIMFSFRVLKFHQESSRKDGWCQALWLIHDRAFHPTEDSVQLYGR
jgi:hypothetical protein